MSWYKRYLRALGPNQITCFIPQFFGPWACRPEKCFPTANGPIDGKIAIFSFCHQKFQCISTTQPWNSWDFSNWWNMFCIFYNTDGGPRGILKQGKWYLSSTWCFKMEGMLLVYCISQSTGPHRLLVRPAGFLKCVYFNNEGFVN